MHTEGTKGVRGLVEVCKLKGLRQGHVYGAVATTTMTRQVSFAPGLRSDGYTSRRMHVGFGEVEL